MRSNKKEYITGINKENSRFCILALTGKVRAGTSDVCELLTNPEFPDNATQPADTSGCDMSEVREQKIVYRYLHHNWRPFIKLSITNVIVSFFLDSSERRLKEEKVSIQGSHNSKESLYNILAEAVKNVRCIKIAEKAKEVNALLHDMSDERKKYDDAIDQICYGNMKHLDLKQVLDYWKKTKRRIYNKNSELFDFVFCFGLLPLIKEQIKKKMGKNNYTIEFQKYGNNIRAYGYALPYNNQLDAAAMFDIPERANKFIKILRALADKPGFKGSSLKENRNANTQKQNEYINKKQVLIVISNFKNIFEAFYFKSRYAAFYLIAVSCDENMRRNKFDDYTSYRLSDLQEELSSGKKILDKVNENTQGRKLEFNDNTRLMLGITEAEYIFVRNIYRDPRLKQIYENNIVIFVRQDVIPCIENADIFVKRDYNEPDYRCDYSLVRQIARIITLLLHPGLLKPTKVERCMQIAMTAKLNSGCLSRQVGAVVTDSQYNILSLGWNDAPCNSESCMRRNLYDLLRKHDEKGYSEFELNDKEFRSYLRKIEKELNQRKNELKGLPLSFCFKDIYQNMIRQRDQIYTRALHGEERALGACDNERAKGGYLFTTSSPCELCAKKAKDALISKIYYIEAYPGISQKHIINSGPEKTWAKYELFTGAVGAAYVKLYTPVLPYKDELAILNFAPRDIYKQIISKEENNRKGSRRGKKDAFGK